MLGVSQLKGRLIFVRVDRQRLLEAIDQAQPTDICKRLLAVTEADPDRIWVQEVALGLLNYPDWQVRGLAVTCLGHLARIHGCTDPEVLQGLSEAAKDPELAGRVSDALDDITIFARPLSC